ncbi:MAG: pseudouridine synthase [Acidimicrobiales bacterium]|nr:MAG: pseudouridine synthase [Acidimicrobiales bacterium]
MSEERIQKLLARAGLGSRRACEELLARGRVRVNGLVATLGDKADPERDLVEVDGVPVRIRQGLVYRLLNKPRGYLTTARDPQGRPTVMDLVPAEPRTFPVGRLDYDTEGLLLLTNDGDLAHRLMHPSHGVEKEYLAHVKGVPSARDLARLRRGVDLDDGVARAVKVSQLQPGLIMIVVAEGRNRLVRRMFEAIGHEVSRLVRTRIGPVRDPRLPPGMWRDLRTYEVHALEAAAVGSGGRGAVPVAFRRAGESSARRHDGRRGHQRGHPRTRP